MEEIGKRLEECVVDAHVILIQHTLPDEEIHSLAVVKLALKLYDEVFGDEDYLL